MDWVQANQGDPVKNWKTNTAGILAIVAAGAYIGKKIVSGQPITESDIGAVIAALTGAGLLAAKDHNK